MDYVDQSEYNKHQPDSCDCSGSCSCNNNSCGTPPPGLVEVFDECSKSAGYLTPHDAELYNNAKIKCVEGYVKLRHPVTNAYLGCVSTEDALALIDALSE